MAQTAIDTVKNADGQFELRRRKFKDIFGFQNEAAFVAYLLELLDRQEDRCELTGLDLQYYGDHDDEQLLCSLDRIDSNGHYSPGNLQIVCRFANRWKSDTPDGEFRRLLRIVREAV